MYVTRTTRPFGDALRRGCWLRLRGDGMEVEVWGCLEGDLEADIDLNKDYW